MSDLPRLDHMEPDQIDSLGGEAQGPLIWWKAPDRGVVINSEELQAEARTLGAWDYTDTARRGLHTNTVLGTTWIPIAHQPFPLYRAKVRHADHSLLTAAGIPAPRQTPEGVLWSPGLDAQVGRPAQVSRRTGIA